MSARLDPLLIRADLAQHHQDLAYPEECLRTFSRLPSLAGDNAGELRVAVEHIAQARALVASVEARLTREIRSA